MYMEFFGQLKSVDLIIMLQKVDSSTMGDLWEGQVKAMKKHVSMLVQDLRTKLNLALAQVATKEEVTATKIEANNAKIAVVMEEVTTTNTKIEATNAKIEAVKQEVITAVRDEMAKGFGEMLN